MYIMGTCCATAEARSRSEVSARIADGELRLQAFGVTEPTSGTDTTVAAHRRGARWRRLRGQRPEDLDQPRRIFRPDAAARAHDPARSGRRSKTEGLSIFIVDMRAVVGKG
jgi:acyl-CoA dehydrogenase